MHWRSIDRTLDVRLRGTNQQTTTGLLHLNSRLSGRGSDDGTKGVKRLQGYQVGYSKLHNRSGATTFGGFGVRIPNWLWYAGQTVASGGAFTDDTDAAQDITTNDFPLETTVNDTGFLIYSDVPFNAISINVSTASVDATNPARTVEYSDGTSGGFTAFGANDVFVQDGAADEYAAGENLIVFAPLQAWRKTTGAETEVTGLPSGKYAIWVRSGTAPDTTAALAKAIEIWRIYGIQENITDNAVVEYNSGFEFAMPYGDAFGALIGSVSAVGSIATALISPGGAFGATVND